MSGRPLSRRDFALSAGATLLAAPFVKTLTARGDAAVSPKRLLVFFSSNGTVYDLWRPAGGETDFKLSRILEPLAAHRDKLLILDGIDNRVAHDDDARNHWGAASILTGERLRRFPEDSPDSSQDFTFGVSVDQFIASRIGSGTAFRSLVVGATHTGLSPDTPMAIINQSGVRGQIAPIVHPQATFDYLFGNSSPTQAPVKRQQSMLDILKGEMKTLSRKVGRQDQIRLEAHLDSFRQVEKQLEVLSTCPVPKVDLSGIPAEPGSPEFSTLFPQVVKAQIDLVTLAMACDLTRVATMVMWNMFVVHSWLGTQSQHHELSHLRGVESENGLFPDKAKEAQAKDDNWSAQMFAYLLDQLTAKGLMDNTVVAWVSEMGDGSNHYFGNIPFVLAGSGGGYFKTGRYLTYGQQRAYADPAQPLVFSGVNHNRLLTSLCHAMGQTDVQTFGAPEFCVGGALDRLTG